MATPAKKKRATKKKATRKPPAEKVQPVAKATQPEQDPRVPARAHWYGSMR